MTGRRQTEDENEELFELHFDVSFDRFVLAIVLFVVSLIISIPSLCLLIRCLDAPREFHDPDEEDLLVHDFYCGQQFLLFWVSLVSLAVAVASIFAYKCHAKLTSKALRQARHRARSLFLRRCMVKRCVRYFSTLYIHSKQIVTQTFQKTIQKYSPHPANFLIQAFFK